MWWVGLAAASNKRLFCANVADMMKHIVWPLTEQHNLNITMQEALGKCWISQLFSCSFCLSWTLFNKSNQATPPPETTAHLWSLSRPPRRDNYNRVIHLAALRHQSATVFLVEMQRRVWKVTTLGHMLERGATQKVYAHHVFAQRRSCCRESESLQRVNHICKQLASI